ncbi:unnamed protein product [Arabidopsis halleri]
MGLNSQHLSDDFWITIPFEKVHLTLTTFKTPNHKHHMRMSSHIRLCNSVNTTSIFPCIQPIYIALR